MNKVSDILCNDLGFLIGPSMGWPPRAVLRGQVDVESELYNFRNIRYLEMYLSFLLERGILRAWASVTSHMGLSLSARVHIKDG